VKKNRTENRTEPYKTKNKRFLLKELHFKILLLRSRSGGFKSFQEIASILNKSKSTVSFHVKKLQRLGYLDTQLLPTKKGDQAGSIFLIGYDEKNPQPVIIRAHDLSFKTEIVRSSSSFKELAKASSWVCYPMKHWTKYVKHYDDGVKVHITTKSVLFWIPDLIGSNPNTVFNQALEIVFHYKKMIEGDLDIVLGTPEVNFEVRSNHLALQFDEFAKLCAEKGITFKSDRLIVDHSGGVPELEAVNKRSARDDLESIWDFYNHLVSYPLKWPEVNSEIKGSGYILKSLLILRSDIERLKERQDYIIKRLEELI